MKKMQNPNRLKGTAMNTEGAKTKKQRITANPWAQVPDLPVGIGLENLKSSVQNKRKELRKKPQNAKLQKDFMEESYPLRRMEILTQPQPVREIVERYPPLNRFSHVRDDFMLGHSDIINVLHFCEFVWPYTQFSQKMHLEQSNM